MATELQEGIELRTTVVLSWRKAGVLGELVALDAAKGAAGIYAFVLDGKLPLYIGKAGGLKPGLKSQWANDIRTRLRSHWKTGPLRGLVGALGVTVEVWFIDFRPVFGDIWERDIELVENEVIRWFRKRDPSSLPGNTGFEGTSSRGFSVKPRPAQSPLPELEFRPEQSQDTRKTKHFKSAGT